MRGRRDSGDLDLTGEISEQFSLDRIQTQGFSHSAETAPVNRHSAELFERATMFRCWITFVRSKALSLVKGVHLKHVSVAGSLGND